MVDRKQTKVFLSRKLWLNRRISELGVDKYYELLMYTFISLINYDQGRHGHAYLVPNSDCIVKLCLLLPHPSPPHFATSTTHGISTEPIPLEKPAEGTDRCRTFIDHPHLHT